MSGRYLSWFLVVAMWFCGCSLVDGDRWVYPMLTKDRVLYYSYVPAEDTTFVYDGFAFPAADTALVYSVLSEGRDDISLGGQHRWIDSAGIVLSPQLRLRRSSEGLLDRSTSSCGKVVFTYRYFLRVPAEPGESESLPQYSCSGRVASTVDVLEVGKSVTVPLGTFETFTLVHSDRTVREVWGTNFVPVRFEIYGRNSEYLGAFELAHIE